MSSGAAVKEKHSRLLWGTVMAEPRAAFLRRERVYIYDDMEEDKHYNRAISFGSLKFD